MANRNFKLREQDYKAMLDMTEKQAGRSSRGCAGYAFDGVPMETKDAKIASAYAYAKTGAGRIGQEPRERQKGRSARGGAYARSESVAVKPSAAESDPMGMLLKGIVLSVAEDAAESKGKK